MMNDTPWSVLQGSITKLSDRVNALPSVREATVAAAEPLAVLFDTDTEPTLAYGTLVAGLQPWNRVVTIKLRHYVWVVGLRGGQLITSFDEGTTELASKPSHFKSGTTIGEVGTGFPAQYGTVFTVYENKNRAYQQVVEKVTGRTWTRNANNDAWTSWRESRFMDDTLPASQLSGVVEDDNLPSRLKGDTGYVTVNYASGFSTSGGSPLSVRKEGHEVKMRGEIVRSGNFAANTLYVVGTLPDEQFWPKEWQYFGSGGSNVTIGVQVVVLNNGDIRVVTGNGGFSYIEFGGINWDTDQ